VGDLGEEGQVAGRAQEMGNRMVIIRLGEGEDICHVREFAAWMGVEAGINESLFASQYIIMHYYCVVRIRVSQT